MPVPRCPGCGLRQAEASRRCGRCVRSPEAWVACRCAVDYGFPWDRLVAGFKYGGRPELARPLAGRLAAALNEADRRWPDWIVPVPLAPARLADRGYNQAWELARRLGRLLDRPSSAAWLHRDREREAQAGLDRAARQRNLRGVFSVSTAHRFTGRRVALVDDVLTTGATAAEATRALLAAGASEVAVWAFARTP